MSNEFNLTQQQKGVVYWPIGIRGSSKLMLKPGALMMQIDLHYLEKADDADEP